ncbi:MAG: hypothetical protein KFF68_16615 [Desulfosarcina sp.]|nr:hypothetical protein [Desulfosarcina sp.]
MNRADDAFAIRLIVNLVVEQRDLARSYPQLKEILYAKAMYNPDLSDSGTGRKRRDKPA